jgi:hypothetical protein
MLRSEPINIDNEELVFHVMWAKSIKTQYLLKFSIRSNEHGLERHRNSLALGQMLNATGKFGNFGFDEAFDREEYDTRNAY